MERYDCFRHQEKERLTNESISLFIQGEDTEPKMAMSERTVAAEEINQKVEDGIKSFEGFQKKLQCIIHALNAQHSSMIELNSNRLKVGYGLL